MLVIGGRESYDGPLFRPIKLYPCLLHRIPLLPHSSYPLPAHFRDVILTVSWSTSVRVSHCLLLPPCSSVSVDVHCGVQADEQVRDWLGIMEQASKFVSRLPIV